MSSNIYIQRICLDCGKEFTARTTVTQYCSLRCGGRNYKKRKRQEMIRESNVETLTARIKPNLDIESKQFLCIVDACALLGISRQSIWRAMKSGRLCSVRIGRRVVIRRQDLDHLVSLEPAAKQGIHRNDKGQTVYEEAEAW